MVDDDDSSSNNSNNSKRPFNPNDYVVHCKKAKFDVYIGRPSKWGNTFVIDKDGTREEVIVKHREWFLKPEQAQLRKDARVELRGMILGCWCKPLACHGDTLASYANGYDDDEKRNE
jgi:Domain of unknown function (DUF4326)